LDRTDSAVVEHLRAQNATLRRYLSTLGDLTLTGEVPLDDLLQRIVDTAQTLLGARYAALAVFDPHRRVKQFYTAGLTTEERTQIGALPVGAGLLGLIVQERRIVRIGRMADHPASVGFPANHPSMTSFLGGPIARGEKIYGNLYLTDRLGAREFSADDEELLALLANQAAIAIENAQRFARVRRDERTTRSLFQIGRSLASLSHPAALVDLVVRETRRLLEADLVALGLRDHDSPTLQWAVIDGSIAADAGLRSVPLGASVAGDVIAKGIVFKSNDLSELLTEPGANPFLTAEHLRSVIVVPIGESGERHRGALLAGWRRPQALPDDAQDILERLADRAAIALAQAKLHQREQTALHQSQVERANLEAIFDSMADAVFTTDPQGRLLRLNRRAAAWAERTAADAIGRPVADVFPLADELGRPSVTTPKLAQPFSESSLLQLGGEAIPVERVVSSIRDARGNVAGTLQVLRDLRPQREVEQLKANIISLVSHELRTPLSHIKGYASSLLQPDVEWDLETQRDFIASIERQADRLARLIGDLLEISQLDAGGTARLEREPVAPTTLVERGLRQAAPNATAHPMHTDLAADLPLVLADASHIERVLSNLVENAAKYSPEGAPIAVKVRRDGDVVVFAVHDQGTGLTDEEKQHLFERFYRSPRVKHRTPGTGLGLAICREIIRAHGGKIWAESVEGDGSVFRFTLPVAAKGPNP
jgi:PAS domain S-box-containing protein